MTPKPRRTAVVRPRTALSDIPSLYTPTERAALARYLGVPDPAPVDLAGIDVSIPVDPDEWDEAARGIAPVASETGFSDLMLENVIARICLQPIEHRLPDWASRANGEMTRGRGNSGPRHARQRRRLRPRHLFTINWGDSGPGFSWPEAYYITRLPGYDVAVVTASADGPDTNGYSDFAIGWSRPGARLRLEDVRVAVTQRWTALRACCQARWSYLFDTGAVDATTAESWRDAVWPEADDDIDE